jgi:hypothetical protein
MSKRLFNDDIKNLLLADLKSMAAKNKWDTSSAKLKSDFQKIVLINSYYDAQSYGINLLDELSDK